MSATAREGRPRRREFLGGLVRRPVALLAILFLALLVFACVAAPLVAPFGPDKQDLTSVLQGPSGAHPLGTDTLGRDILSRLLYGGRASLLAVVEAVSVVLVVGVPLGLIAGYVGGWSDRLLSRLAEILMAIPAIILVLVVLAVLPQNESAAMVTFGLLGVPMVLRVTRSAALKVREDLYITAARVAGLSHPQVLLRHVLPRVRGPVIVQASIFAGYALIFETGLAYLGLTADPTTPTWGGMVAEASTVIQQQAWLLVPPGALIAITILCFGLLGDAIRDAAVSGSAPARSARRRSLKRDVGSRRAEPRLPAAPAAAESLLAVRGLTVATVGSGADALLVDGVDLEVGAGETVGLIGESGCGKSITARAVLGLLPANVEAVSGSVWWEGRDVLGLPERAFDKLRGKTFGYISQEPQAALDPTFTVGSQIAEAVRRHDGASRKAAKARALELLGLVELPEPAKVASARAHELSGGMAQRVALALALAGRPRLLIADEPTTALDVTVQAEILALLRRLQQETGMAILLITHDWGVVAGSCDRTVVMYSGEVVEESATQEMFDHPLHPYTLGLLGSLPSLADHGEPLPTMPGAVPVPGSWPEGCRFAPRCPFASAECRAAAIPLLQPTEGRVSRCIRVEEVLAPVEA